MSTLHVWLAALGLEQYAAVFAENDIDLGVLPELSEKDLAELGVSLGHRKKILKALAEVAPVHAMATTPRMPVGLEAPDPRSYTPKHLADKILQSKSALEGERKTITALFADLKGSTALLEGLDPEVARSVIDPALQIMMDAVHRYEGYVAQALGDGILALFGAPLAHEDHAQRAVFAALKMQEEMKRHSDAVRLKQGAPLAMRVGLNSGEVVVRSIRKDDLHTDYVPVGHSINLAARMEQMATPGSILITAYTQKLVEGYFVLKALGEAVIKGMEQPLAVFEVTGLGQLRTRLQVAASRGLTRFVGRQQELAQMKQALDQAREGRGQVIGIMGEPGMGKSRLVHEFKADAVGFVVFEAYSASHGKASPYLPITELLKGYFQIQLQDDERARREKVIGKLLGLDRSLEEVLPYYFALLNIEDADSPLPQMDAPSRRRRTFDALKRVTLRASLEQPVLLIFEDLHWIDSETQGFLDGLVESIGSARILLLTNYRPEYRHEWGAKTYCTQLRLAPFGRAEAEEFLSALLGEPADSTNATHLRDLRHWILEKTEGTPFFMEEVVQELFEQGILQRDLHGKALSPLQAITNIQIPTTVQGVLAARIDRLPSNEKALLQQLAVIGREFAFSLARSVVGRADDELHQLLNALQKKEFLYEQPAFPEVEYLFKHALTQEVAYNTLLQETRKVIHEKTAQVIEAAYGLELEDHLGNLAHHYTRSGNVVKAIEYSQLAGVQATQRAASTDAVNYFTTALTLLRTLQPSLERDRKEFTLLIALGAQLVSRGITSPEVGETYLQARRLFEKAGTSAELCAVLIGLHVHFLAIGEPAKALMEAQELLRLAKEIPASDLMCYGYYALNYDCLFSGRLIEAQMHAEAVLQLYSPERDRHQTRLYGYDTCVVTINNKAHALWLLGFPDQALQLVEQSHVHARTLGYPFMDRAALMWAAICHALRRDYRRCQDCAEGLLLLEPGQVLPEYIAWARILCGWARSQLGECGTSAEIVQGRQDAAHISAHLLYPLWVGCLAETCLNERDFAAALEAFTEARAMIARTNEHWFDAELSRLHGEILLRRPATDSAEAERLAETAFEHGIQIAREQQAKSWELRTATSLAQLWQSQRKFAEAHALLAPIYGWFTEGFDTKDLQEAKALLDELRTAQSA